MEGASYQARKKKVEFGEGLIVKGGGTPEKEKSVPKCRGGGETGSSYEGLWGSERFA